MFRFAIRNLLTKKAQAILIMLSIIVSASVSGIAVNVSNQIEDGITSTAGWYSLIIGPSGSSTQLAMNTMYFTDKPLGTIPKSLYAELKRDTRVKEVIPYAMADSYNGYNLVGTTSLYLSGKELSEGKMFDDTKDLEVVVGNTVAKKNNLKIGDKIKTSHSEGEEHDISFTVVGILADSHSVYDEVVFTQIKSIWTVHEHNENEEHHHDMATSEMLEEDEEDEQNHGVCAYLIKTAGPGQALQLKTEYDNKVIQDEDGDNISLQAIEPMETVRSLLDDMDTTKYVMRILCIVILLMNILVIIIITLLNMYHAKDEIKLMRLIGISLKKINIMYGIQNITTGLISIIGAYFGSHIGLSLISNYVRKMGVTLNIWKTYGIELSILITVFLISVIPTFICISIMSKKKAVG